MNSWPANSFRNEQGPDHAIAQLPLPDWREVSPGHEVSLYKKGQGHFRGRVDDFTSDGAIVWVHLEGGWGRRMFVRADGYRLTLHWSGAASVQENRTS